MHIYGDCSLCGGQVSPETVELDYRYKDLLYIFQDVPAGVCQQCGEQYLIAEVSKEIEHKILAKEGAKKTITVPVYVFPEEKAV
jgi:YgiT-type zinc finger domain-containing protein